MATFYLNENVNIHLVDILKDNNIEAIHTIHINNCGKSDESQLLFAAENKYILVTHNRKHFRKLHNRWLKEGKFHSGILILAQDDPFYLAHRIKLFLTKQYSHLEPPFCITPLK